MQTSLFLHNRRHCQAVALAYERYARDARKTIFITAPTPCAIEYALLNPQIETHFVNSKDEYVQELKRIDANDAVMYVTGHSSKEGLKLGNREHITSAEFRRAINPDRIRFLIVDSCYAQNFALNSKNAVFSSTRDEESASYGVAVDGFANVTLFAHRWFVLRSPDGVQQGVWRKYL